MVVDEFVRASISASSVSGSGYLPDGLNSLQSWPLMWSLSFDIQLHICKTEKGKMARRGATDWVAAVNGELTVGCASLNQLRGWLFCVCVVFQCCM